MESYGRRKYFKKKKAINFQKEVVIALLKAERGLRKTLDFL